LLFIRLAASVPPAANSVALKERGTVVQIIECWSGMPYQEAYTGLHLRPSDAAGVVVTNCSL
jgi:hypothetical protein